MFGIRDYTTFFFLFYLIKFVADIIIIAQTVNTLLYLLRDVYFSLRMPLAMTVGQFRFFSLEDGWEARL